MGKVVNVLHFAIMHEMPGYLEGKGIGIGRK
jgi:hypothetical protein